MRDAVTPLPDCARCQHSPDHHSLRDEQNVSPVDSAARFPCNGPGLHGCISACPDYQQFVHFGSGKLEDALRADRDRPS
jgi:hypothetical protein